MSTFTELPLLLVVTIIVRTGLIIDLTGLMVLIAALTTDAITAKVRQ